MNQKKLLLFVAFTLTLSTMFNVECMKRKNEESPTKSKTNKKQKPSPEEHQLNILTLAQKASRKIDSKLEEYWTPLDEEELKKTQIYQDCTKTRNKSKAKILESYLKADYLTKGENTWEKERELIAAAYLAGAKTDEYSFNHKRKAVENNDGPFIYFLFTKYKTFQAIAGKADFHCKTTEMIELMIALNGAKTYKQHLILNLTPSFFLPNCEWQVLDYCLKNSHKEYGLKELIKYINLWIRAKNIQSNPYNHLKKLYLLLIFDKKTTDVLVKNEGFIKCFVNKNLKNIFVNYKWFLESALECLGDYGNFPERKIFGTQIKNSASFDCKLFYKVN